MSNVNVNAIPPATFVVKAGVTGIQGPSGPIPADADALYFDTLADLEEFDGSVPLGTRLVVAGRGEFLVDPDAPYTVSPTVIDLRNGAGQAVSTSLTQDCTFAEDTRTIAFLRSVYESSATVTATYAGVAAELDLAQVAASNAVTAGGVKLNLAQRMKRTSMPATAAFTGAAAIAALGRQILTQADGSNLSSIATITASAVSEPAVGDFQITVDGNNQNNATPVTGISITQLKRARNKLVLTALNCDKGVSVEGNVEYAKIDAATDYCDVGIEVAHDGGTTPDEIMIDQFAHACGVFFATRTRSGNNKTSGLLRIVGEQCDGYGIEIDQGWWQLFGELRGVGNVDGGGLRIRAANTLPPRVSGMLDIWGSDGLTTKWILDTEECTMSALHINAGVAFGGGARIGVKTEGSVLFNAINNSRESPCMHLGYSAAGTGFLVGFHVLPGSKLIGGTGLDALFLDRCDSCIIEATSISGRITISANSVRNRIVVQRREALQPAHQIVNNNLGGNNIIFYRGDYTLAELNALNGGVLFQGMKAESCATFRGAAMIYDSKHLMWVPDHGRLTGGTITVPAGALTANVPHLLPDPRTSADLSIYPSSDLGSGKIDRYAVSSSVVAVELSAASGSDVTFEWSLRKRQ